MTAKEARERTEKAITNKEYEILYYVVCAIQSAADEGEYSVAISDLSPYTLNSLQKMVIGIHVPII